MENDTELIARLRGAPKGGCCEEAADRIAALTAENHTLWKANDMLLDRATKAEAALAERAREPYLGLATTKQLIDELAARADVSAINGEAWPSYWTAMPDALAKEPK